MRVSVVLSDAGSFSPQSIALAAYLRRPRWWRAPAWCVYAPDSTLSGRQLLRLAGTLLLKAVPIMLIMYLLFPRIQGILWGLPQTPIAVSPISDERPMYQSTEPVRRGRVPVNFCRRRPSRICIGGCWCYGTATAGLNSGVSGQWPAYSFQTKDRPVTYEISLTEQQTAAGARSAGRGADELRLRAGCAMDRSQPVRERLRYELTSYLRMDRRSRTRRTPAQPAPADRRECACANWRKAGARRRALPSRS